MTGEKASSKFEHDDDDDLDKSHLDIPTPGPVLEVFPTTHPAVRLPLNLIDVFLIRITIEILTITEAKKWERWDDHLFVIYKDVSSLRLVSHVLRRTHLAQTFWEINRHNFRWVKSVTSSGKVIKTSSIWGLSTLDSAFQSSFRFSILTSPPPARWVAWYSADYYHHLFHVSDIFGAIIIFMSQLNGYGSIWKKHLLKGSHFRLCVPLEPPLLNLGGIKYISPAPHHLRHNSPKIIRSRLKPTNSPTNSKRKKPFYLRHQPGVLPGGLLKSSLTSSIPAFDSQFAPDDLLLIPDNWYLISDNG